MKKAFTSDTAFKIYSALIAILLWVFVVYNQNPESTKVISGIKISYTNAAELEKQGLVIVKSEREPSLSITVKGRRLSVGRVDSGNVLASVTVPELRVGEYEVLVNASLPISDVSITDKKPYAIKVTVETLKSAEVPVRIKYTGIPKEESTAVRAEVSPKTVLISGPETIVNKVQAAEVTLDVSDISDGKNIKHDYRLLAADGSDLTEDANLRVSADTVSVTPAVYNVKDVKIEAQFYGEMPNEYAIASYTASPATVRLGSVGDTVFNVDKILTEPIDISSLTESKAVSAKLVIPQEATNMFSVEETEVNITVERMSEKTVSVERVAFRNAENKRSYSALNLPAAVTLRGAKSILDKYTPAAWVDVSGAEEGNHTLALHLDLPDGVVLAGDYTAEINVSAAASEQAQSE